MRGREAVDDYLYVGVERVGSRWREAAWFVRSAADGQQHPICSVLSGCV